MTEIPEAPDSIPGRRIGWVLAATVLAIVAAAVIVWVLDAFDITGGGEQPAARIDSIPPSAPFSSPLPAPPRNLDAYTWADAAHTRVRLPANAAIDRYLREGGR